MDPADVTGIIDVDNWHPPTKPDLETEEGDVEEEEEEVKDTTTKNGYVEVAPSPTETAVKRHVDARLHWENVQLDVVNRDNRTTILDGVWGESPQGEVSAIMGPSGSGKTSLLNILSGRMSNATANISVQADTVTWNGSPLDVTDLATRQTIAFVAQDDSLPITSTPREAIMFSARLRLDKDLTQSELEEITDTMLSQLHLENCADTLVGGALLKGISGGERKRTSVGVELVCKPKLIFLDEPTSGLDSFNALELVQVLKQVAETGSAVMLTIHQPSSEIWELFDRLTLLKRGRVMYEGRRDGVPNKFASCGYPLPTNYNPADWVMHCAQAQKTEVLEQAGFFPVNDFSTHGKTLGDSMHSRDGLLTVSATAGHRVGFSVQTKWLLKREFMHFKRNTHPLRTRTGMTIMISLLAGVLFYEAAEEDFTNFINLQTAFGALLLALMGNMFPAVFPALVAFPEERPVFLREYTTGCYSVHAYFAARLTMELLVSAVQVTISTAITYTMIGFTQPYGLYWTCMYAMALTATALGVMLGASVSDASVAIEFLPAVFMPQILFSGFFIPKESMPEWLAWLTYVFSMTYAMRLLLVYEFEECEGTAQTFCDILLDNADAHSEDMWWYWLVLFAQFAFFRLLALLILQQKAKRFY